MGTRSHIGTQLFSVPGAHQGMSPQLLAASDAGAGIEHYWGYEVHSIPGIGQAMVNIGTGNLLIQATDVAIPQRGLDLVMRRTYNSQSLHDANGDDGGQPAIFGNGWTNTYDAHITFRWSGPTLAAISVYDMDGTRCDYTPATDQSGNWVPCAGEHAILEVDPSTPCSYWWIKKNGTAYWFHTDTTGINCASTPGAVGNLYKIVGRNSNNWITLQYSFVPNQPPSSQTTTEIDVNHSDGQSLKMTFAQLGTSGPNELSTITYPDPAHPAGVLKISYGYDPAGDLQEVDRPGNDTVPVLPETYGIQHPLQFACGPRATIARRLNPANPADGACMNFDYDNNVRLIDWIANGVGNFTPNDSTGLQLQPGVPGWSPLYTANFIYGAGTGTACGTTITGTTTLCDSDGHSTIWTVDSSSRITQTQEFTGGTNPTNLVTSQTWDPSNNNLLSSVDANLHETDYAYDSHANTIAVKFPAPISGQNHPTAVYAYDSNNNLTSYCDPVYSNGHGLDWNSVSWPSGQECPGGNGTTHYAWAPPSDGSEPYGQLTDAYTACYSAACTDAFNGIAELGYHVLYAYNQYGQPLTVAGAAGISQPTGYRNPTQTLGYDGNGNLTSYSAGGGTWTLFYDALNRMTSRIDPDQFQPTSYVSYNSDGSVHSTQTPYQHFLNQGHVMTYDADGNEISQTLHRNQATGEIDKYYDGLDRLVEVVEPHSPGDVLASPWITRYYYDLTQGGKVTFGTSAGFRAYGNLFATYELLPSSGVSQTYKGTQLNPQVSFQPLKGTRYDGVDRPIGGYSIVNGTTDLATSTYDAVGKLGLPDTQRQPIPIGQQSTLCKTDASYDNNNHVTEVTYQDPSSSTRTYTYDFDGRTLTASNGDSTHTQKYFYDPEGRVVNSQEPKYGTSPATYTHEFYPDGKLKQLDVDGHGLESNRPVHLLVHRRRPRQAAADHV